MNPTYVMTLFLGVTLWACMPTPRIRAETLFSRSSDFSSQKTSADYDEEFFSLSSAFFVELKTLEIPKLSLSYLENFSNIQNLEGIRRQRIFFNDQSHKLKFISRSHLSPSFRYQYDALKYEIDLNLERLRLESRLRNSPAEPIPQNGLYQVSYSREWYAFFLRKWTSENITPESLLALGLAETLRVKSKIQKIQNSLGFKNKDQEFYSLLNSPDFLITRESELVAALHRTQASVTKNLNKEFSELNITSPEMRSAPNPNKGTPPGFYSRGIFYYNFFQNSFQKRNLVWLYLHEAIPGHHYQSQIAVKSPKRFPVSQHFLYPGFTEGWAAYSENLGHGLGAYTDVFSLLGKWEWDLVRSVRVILDVGIHYLGWSKPQAREFWHQNIPNQDSIADREIDRIIRWPAQVASYKVGEVRFLKLRQNAESQGGAPFNPRSFHSLILDQGPLPLEVISSISTKDQTHTKLPLTVLN